jgi:hypothetical protein
VKLLEVETRAIEAKKNVSIPGFKHYHQTLIDMKEQYKKDA